LSAALGRCFRKSAPLLRKKMKGMLTIFREGGKIKWDEKEGKIK
jgi:hypothetical protein